MRIRARILYESTYRAIRKFANGTATVNPMCTLKTLENTIGFPVCVQTHDAMINAQRSFNQRFLAPVGVHETELFHLSTIAGEKFSDLRRCSPETIHARLHFMKLQQYAAGVTRKHSRLFMLECAERMAGAQVKAHMPAKPFDYVLWSHTL